MADIYENAFVTIAATCAANSDDGLRPFRNRFKALRLGFSEFFVREMVGDFSRDYGHCEDLWPLLSRAWAFQESQLAPRTLRFSCYGTFLDCRTTRATQERLIAGHDLGGDTIDLLPFFLSGISTPDPNKAWRNTIEAYSRLDLTYRTDTLPAIAALAQRMSRLRPNDTYLAGMWRNTLLSDIQWHRVRNYPRKYSPRQEFELPTWSWATTQGARFTSTHSTLHSVEILGLDYTLVGPPEIGAIKDAVLAIRGPTLRLIAQAADSADSEDSEDPDYSADSSRYYFDFSSSSHAAFWAEQVIDFVPDHDFSLDFYLDGSQAFLALFVCSSQSELDGILLRQVETVYERVGWFSLDRGELEKEVKESLMEQLAQLPLTTVRII